MRGNEFYRMYSFRHMICELMHNAINMFPEISQYSIICKNNIGTATMDISLDGYIDPDPQFSTPGIAKITNKFGTYILHKQDIMSLYVATKVKDPEDSIVNVHALNFMCELLYQTGYEPIISTTFINNPKKISSAMKSE